MDQNVYEDLGTLKAKVESIEDTLDRILNKLDVILDKLNDNDRRITALEISHVRQKETKKFFMSNWKLILGGLAVAAAAWIRSVVMGMK